VADVIFGSVCSGIEAASVAWHPLGWRASFLSEIEAFPRSVLAHHYPETPLHGDFTTIKADEYEPIDLLVGGTPCQSFSVAGLRGGLADERGNLALEYLRLAQRLRPRWVVWENVPGVLSSTSHDAPDICPPNIDLDAGNGPKDGEEVVVIDEYDADESHAVACFLAGLSELGYGWAYGTLDAQYAGVAQRRRRVFVVGHLGDWRRAAAVLFERHSLSGNPAPRREAGPSVAALTANGVGDCGADDNQGQAGHLIQTFDRQSSGEYGSEPVASTVSARDYKCASDLIAHTLKGEGFDASEDGTGWGTPIVPVCFSAKDHGADAMSDLSPTLRAGGHSKSHANAGVMPAVAFALRGRDGGAMPEIEGDGSRAGALRAASGGSSRDYVAFNARQDPGSGPVTDALGTRDTGHGILLPTSAVRRLTPRECERLQGFPDDYTAVPHRGKPAADGPRYKALGNSMAVPVMRWIGERIQAVEDITSAFDAPPTDKG
jgi:DNA (cytosine-5)-methyltransferase 1